MDVDLTEPQTDFFTSEAAYTAAVAGFGSGKTIAAWMRLLATKMRYPSIDLAYYAPTYALIRDIFYPYVEADLDKLRIPYHINKQENILHIQGYGQVFCRTMDNPELIVGYQVGDAFLDEFDVLDKEKAIRVIRKVKARMRQHFPDKKKHQMFISTTPEGFKATYELFKKNPLEDSSLVQMSTHSNAHNLPDDYIQGLYDMYPEQLIEAYINGEFVNLVSGGCFPKFSREQNGCNTEIQDNDHLYIGQDFNVGKQSSVIYVKREEFVAGERIPQLHAADEIMQAFDTEETIQIIKERYPKHKITMVPDASGKARSSSSGSTTDFTLLREAKFKIDTPTANPLVKDRIISTNAAIRNSKGVIKFKVNVDRCPDFTAAMEQIVFNKNGQMDKAHDLDHPVDAGTYPIDRYFPVRKVQAAQVQVIGGY